MWRGAIALVMVMAMPAFAAQGATITATATEFTPREVTIAPGESVKLANSSGIHNFVFADGAYPPGATPADDAVWDDLSRTFATVGDYAFVCSAHPDMTGVVRVREPSETPSPTPSETPDPQPGAAPLEVRRLELAARTLCPRRCAVRLRVDLSQPAAVSGTLRRRGRTFGRVRFGTVAAGPRTLRFRRTASGRRLVAGRYVLRLEIAGDQQPALRFKVR